jgi:hypothetical protein
VVFERDEAGLWLHTNLRGAEASPNAVLGLARTQVARNEAGQLSFWIGSFALEPGNEELSTKQGSIRPGLLGRRRSFAGSGEMGAGERLCAPATAAAFVIKTSLRERAVTILPSDYCGIQFREPVGDARDARQAVNSLMDIIDQAREAAKQYKPHGDKVLNPDDPRIWLEDFALPPPLVPPPSSVA